METVNSKDALLMLDTDMASDMKAYKEELTLMAIKYINSTPRMWKNMKNVRNLKQNLKFAAQGWARENNNEFGPLFETELDLVDWKKVAERI